MPGLWASFVCEWKNDPLTVSFETAGTSASILAGVLLSFQITGLIPVYVCWLAGSLLLTVSSWRRHNTNLVLLMTFYTVLNVIGLWNFS